MHVPKKKKKSAKWRKKLPPAISSWYIMLHPTYFITSQGKKTSCTVSKQILRFEYKLVTKCFDILGKPFNCKICFLICNDYESITYFTRLPILNENILEKSIKHNLSCQQYFQNHSNLLLSRKMTKGKYKGRLGQPSFIAKQLFSVNPCAWATTGIQF